MGVHKWQCSIFTNKTKWNRFSSKIFDLKVTFINLNLIIIQKIFNFDIKDLNWHSYIEQYCLGIKKFVLNEDLSKMNNCRKELER